MRSVNPTAFVRNDLGLTVFEHPPTLREMDHPVRFAVGALLALVAASVLVWTVGKPPGWDPRFIGLRPRGLGGRDRVRIYALVTLIAGAVVAIYFGILVR
jgi:hypothetical protein